MPSAAPSSAPGATPSSAPPATPPAAEAQPRRDPGLARQTQTLALAAWDLARTRTSLPDSPRGHLIALRNQQRLVASFEKERRIPTHDQSFLRVKEDARGSCLLVHGVSTSPGHLRELGERLFLAGYNVYVLRMPDYGTPGHTISEVSWEAAFNQVTQCFGLLSRGPGKVHVVGLGFGATLALLLASKEKVASLVLLAPAIMPRESFFQRMLVRLKLHRLGFVHRWLGWNWSLMAGMDRARGRIGQIRVPIYGVQCEDDEHASPSSVRILQRKAAHSASRFQIFPEGGHDVLAAHGDAMLFEEIIKFISTGK